MKIKTRNFLISFLMLLTLVFGVFAFMPKTTMTASAASETVTWNNQSFTKEQTIGYATDILLSGENSIVLSDCDYGALNLAGSSTIGGSGKLTITINPTENSRSLVGISAGGILTIKDSAQVVIRIDNTNLNHLIRGIECGTLNVIDNASLTIELIDKHDTEAVGIKAGGKINIDTTGNVKVDINSTKKQYSLLPRAIGIIAGNDIRIKKATVDVSVQTTRNMGGTGAGIRAKEGNISIEDATVNVKVPSISEQAKRSEMYMFDNYFHTIYAIDAGGTHTSKDDYTITVKNSTIKCDAERGMGCSGTLLIVNSNFEALSTHWDQDEKIDLMLYGGELYIRGSSKVHINTSTSGMNFNGRVRSSNNVIHVDLTEGGEFKIENISPNLLDGDLYYYVLGETTRLEVGALNYMSTTGRDDWATTVDGKFILRYNAAGNATIPSASITVPEPVEGLTPADVNGTLNTEGLTINKETWYEVKGGTLRSMAEDEPFVEGKQYKYEAFVASTVGYQLASDFYLTINESFASGNGGLWKMKTPVTAKAVLTAKAQNDVTSATVKYNDYAQFVVDVNGGSGSPTYTWTKSEGAPNIVAGGADYQHHIDVKGTKNGTFTYTCVVTDGAETQTVTFTLTVQEQVTYYAAAPDVNGLVGTGNKHVDLLVGESVTLIPDYVLIENNYEVSGSNLTPRKGTISISWWIFTIDDSKGVHITADQLVVDDDVADYLNTSKTGSYYVQIEITNYVDDSEYGSATRVSHLLNIYVVETGNLGGQIGAEQEQAIPYAMRKMSARSANNFEGTIVYLVKDEAIVYATEADAQGYYMFTNIPYGSYSVKVEKEGYEDYNKPVEVNAEEVTHDVTIIIHVCFADEGMTMHQSASLPICSDVTEGTLGNIEYRGCIACGKFYDMEGNLIADSANDPGSVNEMGVPYKAIIYPVHDYCGEAQEGGDADRYLRHRAETCLEDTTYWYHCIYCKKSAGDDPMAVDKYYVGSASNQTHSYTLEIADEYFFYQGGETCKDPIWYYHACEYCYEKSPSSVWESEYYGAHIYGEDTTCDVCGYVHTHAFADVYSADENNHWYECACGEKSGVEAHTPNADDGDCTTEITCSACGKITTAARTHVDTDTNGKCDTCGKDMPTTPGGVPDSGKDNGKKKGCGSTITGTSLGMLTLACAGAFVFLKKRKEN